MKAIKKYLVVLFAFCFIISCEKPNKENSPKEIQGELINHSECKDFSDKSLKSSQVASNVSQVDYIYDTLTNTLTLNHLNAAFNCCPGRLYCNISIQNDTIFIEEKDGIENGLACSCNCLYDLEILVTGVQAQSYIIKFIEPYYHEDEKLIFEIDLTQKSEDYYSVIRDYYPWGLH